MKVLIVDDDNLMKEGLKILLELESDVEVVGMMSNGQEAVDYCKNNIPDVILMDIRMPIMDGVLGTKHIKEMKTDIKILILTTFKDEEYIQEAMNNGADGYMLKNQGADRIVDAVRSVYKGHIVFDHQIRASLFNNMTKIEAKDFKSFNITDREFDILTLLGNGYSNNEIAAELYLSSGTIRNYITTLLDKLELRDRTQLALFYVKNFE